MSTAGTVSPRNGLEPGSDEGVVPTRPRLGGYGRSAAICSAAVLASRLALFIVGQFAQRFVGSPTGLGAAQNLPDFWIRFDGIWYMQVARAGYSLSTDYLGSGASDVAFFPVWPLLLRYAGDLISLRAAALILPSGLLLIGSVPFHVITSRRLDEKIANLSVLSLCFFPGSFVFSAPMTESLFFLLLVATFYYLASRRWLAACVGASLLTVTRVNGAAAACAVGVAWLHDRISIGRTSTMWRELLLITLIPLPMCLFMGFMYGRFGDAFAAFNAHRYFWANQPVWPFHNLLYVFYGPDLRGRLQSGVSLIAAAAFILQWRSFTIEEIVLVVLTLLMTTSTYVGGLLSTPRYLLPLYPIHMAVGSLTDRYQWAAVLIPSLCLINGLLMVFWSQGATFFI